MGFEDHNGDLMMKDRMRTMTGISHGGRERELNDLGFRASWALRTIIKRGSHDEGPNEDHDGDLTRRP